ncbi:anti-sigma factor domain-containing protein [Jannaschia sp. M317]|uniref:anti-sigma factor n=1 Tax=Jannaschia sp. M317 TaxID=2867011 RepID=UPI0021A4F454|nr:anti-sigma factor [Jannaschia sp. M317]UWQ19388.1 anti-sigma factor [Jannaschia sp. M317]
MTGSADIPDDDAVLIGEYVLGLLPEAQEQTLARRLERESELQLLHAVWQEDLQRLAAGRDVPPPVHLRPRIEARLFPERAPARRGWLGWAALLGVPIAAFAVSFVMLQPTVVPFAPTQGAEIASAEGLVLRARADADQIVVTRAAGTAPPGRVLELWVIAGTAAPVSLGLLPAEGDLRLPRPSVLVAGVVLAVSSEPPGGSPTGQPTGPVLGTAPLADL